ncbi:uncharacterized protein BDR25DRAFT_347243 [Lindgomyces ingoldianus]|uniref:Uncharacterized protein n=1 Tax=Lindgomyces ingoldianus TaxID=673940 RepID=A0ACB6QA85_9PLEO|nr:uncharacterized protein BDR25DRAFT_347243 [Lindgomyces ingoldianus]KAF2463493.1 hypothetical protein BDR25DRAFT_347243 [Lindgomyces ingoldianus]
MSPSSRFILIGGFALLVCFATGYPIAFTSSSWGLLSGILTRTENDCTTHKTIIKKLILFNLEAFLAVLFGGNRRLGYCGRKRYPGDNYTIDFNIFTLIFKLGGLIATTYGLAVITRPPGGDARIWDFFQLWAIRPRATPFISLLGYHRGWTGAAFYSFVVDSIICLIAAQFVGTATMVSGDFAMDKGNWPSYRVGAVIALIPLIFFVIVGLAMAVFLGAVAVCCGPCFACLACCRVFEHGQRENEPWTMPWETKDFLWYTGWMMWSGMPLELWCPIMANRVDLMMGLSPFAIQIGMMLIDSISEWVI